MLLLEWLGREGWIIASWWLLVTLAGVAAAPILLRLLPGLPDRGWLFARAAGLLLVGWVYWLLANAGLTANQTGGMVLAWALVLGTGIVLWDRRGMDWRAWWGRNRTAVIVGEVIFLLLLLGWAVFRAYQPDTFTTEKPMELAFINGTMRSETFPPNDPWLAGYSISYYYLGYVLAAMLSMLSGVSGAVGFSMTNALLVALTGLTSFGVVYNLVRSREGTAASVGRWHAPLIGVLGTLLVVFLGNYQLPLIEIPYQTGVAPTAYYDYWGVQGRNSADGVVVVDVNPPGTWTPVEEWSYWWFFRASRIVTDTNLDGSQQAVQPIDEFPQFSFVLADNHPHVLALPFVLLTIGLALHTTLSPRAPGVQETVLQGVVIGGLIFLNTWDGPIYLVLLVAGDALRRMFRSGRWRLDRRDWRDMVLFGAGLAGVALLAYLPFFIGFRSQAAGLVPNIINPTLFRQYFLMFGPLLLVGAAFLALETWRGQRAGAMNWRLGLVVSAAILFGLFAIASALTLLSALLPGLGSFAASYIDQNGGLGAVLPAIVERRLAGIVLTLVMSLVLVVVIARLFARTTPAQPEEGAQDTGPLMAYPPATGFVLVLVGLAAMLTLLPEFVYLRDNFGVRINTIFKFYYQVWVALSLVSAYAVYTLFLDERQPRPAFPLRTVTAAVLVVALLAGFLYPVFAIYSRTMVETGRATGVADERYPLPETPGDYLLQVRAGEIVEPGQVLATDQDASPLLTARRAGLVRIRDGEIALAPLLTMDGGPTLVSADDYAVIRCLEELVTGDDVIAVEAGDASYRSTYARIGSLTGIPILHGWAGHQGQWRGSAYGELAGGRLEAIETLYSTPEWEMARQILEQYAIDYILFGATERQEWGSAADEKFASQLDVVCESGASRIYRFVPAQQGQE